jgi:hypothetical protein
MTSPESPREALFIQALEALLFEAGHLGIAPERLARAAMDGLLDESRFYRSSGTDEAAVSIEAIQKAFNAIKAYPEA